MYKVRGYTFYCFLGYLPAGILILWLQVTYGVVGSAFVFNPYAKPWADKHLYFAPGRYDRESMVKDLEAAPFKGESPGVIRFSLMFDTENFIDVYRFLQWYEKGRAFCGDRKLFLAGKTVVF